MTEKGLKRTCQDEGENGENLDFYHGLLPREDLPYLLKRNGDFLIRTSEVKPGQETRQIILSVCINDVDTIAERDIKHIVIQKSSDGKFGIDNRNAFDSIFELCDYHVRHKVTVFMGKDVKIYKSTPRAHWELSHENITLLKKLGEGAFGEVHKGILIMKDGRRPDVAVKLAKNTAMTKEKIKEMMREARLMRNFSYHPNIVQLYGVAVEREPLMIVMELVNGGALDEYLKNHKECTTSERLDNMVCGAAFGLEYLHSVPVLHRDIAARNCLYSNGVCKISDFGLSREGEKYVLQVVRKCPIKWLAPEVIQTLTYTQKTDIWSFGIFAWEVFAGSEPYPGMNNAEVKERVTNGYKMEFPCETPPDLVQLITDICWAMEPDKRSTMKELVVRLCAISGVVPPVVTQSNMSNIASGQDIIPGQEDKEKERKHKKKGHKKSKKEQREKERDKDRGKEREKDKEKDDDYVSESSRVVKKHKKRKI